MWVAGRLFGFLLAQLMGLQSSSLLHAETPDIVFTDGLERVLELSSSKAPLTAYFPFYSRTQDPVFIESVTPSDSACSAVFPKRVLKAPASGIIVVTCPTPARGSFHLKRFIVRFRAPVSKRGWTADLRVSADVPKSRMLRPEIKREAIQSMPTVENQFACEGEPEYMLDRPGGPLEGFKPYDQSTLSSCYANSLSLLLKTALPDHPDVSYNHVNLMLRAIYDSGGGMLSLVAAALKYLEIPLYRTEDFRMEHLVRSNQLSPALQKPILDAYRAFQYATQGSLLNPFSADSKAIRTELANALESAAGARRERSALECEAESRPSRSSLVSQASDHYVHQLKIQRYAIRTNRYKIRKIEPKLREARKRLDLALNEKRPREIKERHERILFAQEKLRLVVQDYDAAVSRLKEAVSVAARLQSVIDQLGTLDARTHEWRPDPKFPAWLESHVTESDFSAEARDRFKLRAWIIRLLNENVKAKSFPLSRDVEAILERVSGSFDADFPQKCVARKMGRFTEDAFGLIDALSERAPRTDPDALSAFAELVPMGLRLYDLDTFIKLVKASASIVRGNDFTIANAGGPVHKDRMIRIPKNARIIFTHVPWHFEVSTGRKVESLGDRAPLYSYYRAKVLSHLRDDRAVVASVQTSIFKDPNADTRFRRLGGSAQNHMVSIIGFRCKNNQAQYLIQNSWGEASDQTYSKAYEVDFKKGRFWIPENTLINNSETLESIRID